MANWTDHLFCIYDRGRVKSVGRFVTRLDETVEVGVCPFDGFLSGFRCSGGGWEPMFLLRSGPRSFSFWDDTEGQRYTEEELASEAGRLFAEGR